MCPAAGSQADSPADIGSTVFIFGKHKGRSFSDVYTQEAGYVAWAKKQIDTNGQLAEFIEYIAAPSRSPRVGSRTPPRPRPGHSASSPTSRQCQVGPDEGNCGETIFSIGKHSGRTFHDVFANDKSYVSWAKKTDGSSGQIAEFRDYVASQAEVSEPCSRTPPRGLIGSPTRLTVSAEKAQTSPRQSEQVCSDVVEGETVFSIGKHSGRSFHDVFTNEKGYVSWAKKTDGSSGQIAEFRDYIALQAGASRTRSRTPPRGQIGSPSRLNVSGEKLQKPLGVLVAGQSSTIAEADGGDTVFTIGKHKGRTFHDVFANERGYVTWAQGLENASGQMAAFFDYIIVQLALEQKRQRTEARIRRSNEREQDEADHLVQRAADGARREADRRRAELVAQDEYQAFLKCKFDEYKAGYPNLHRFEQLRTGHDPFGDIIKKHGDSWMQTPNHKHYRSQDNWDPRKILEWGLTYYDKFSMTASPEAIRKQKAAIELMLRQCCLLVKPNVKRKIYWMLQHKHKTFSRDIERVFGKIFTELEKRAAGREASAQPPENVDETAPAVFFGDSFTWSWDWPVGTHVAIGCKFYMWNRSECERGKESAEATDRRILLIQMLLAFKDEGDIQSFANGDGSEVLYKAPGGKASILVEAPDEGAVHVFDCPKGVSDTDHRDRIFALFRHFNSLVTRKITCCDGTQAYARVGDCDELPEDFVMKELVESAAKGDCDASEKSKVRTLGKHQMLLDAHPEIKAALTILPKTVRPSLQEFLGWRTIITHRKQELTKTAFEDALDIPLERAKAVEGQAIAEIREARLAGEGYSGEVDFHGGSWH